MAIKTSRKVAFFLILSKNTIRQPADILIAFEFFLIVVQISIGQNKICSIENKISRREIAFFYRKHEFSPNLIMRRDYVIFNRRQQRWILSDSRGYRMRYFFYKISITVIHRIVQMKFSTYQRYCRRSFKSVTTALGIDSSSSLSVQPLPFSQIV